MSFSSVGNRFHTRGAATENARSPNRRSVRGRKRLPLLEARSDERVGMTATGVSMVGDVVWCVLKIATFVRLQLNSWSAEVLICTINWFEISLNNTEFVTDMTSLADVR